MGTRQRIDIIGHVGKDPEVRYTASGTAAANVSVATSRKWRDKSSGEMVEQTEWHRCVAYDKLGELIGQHVKKGDLIHFGGRLQTRKWQDKEGIDRYTTDLVVEDMTFLAGSQAGDRHEDAQPARQQGPRDQPRPNKQGGSSFDDMEDDIPF